MTVCLTSLTHGTIAMACGRICLHRNPGPAACRI
jgi:hypothetical protein